MAKGLGKAAGLISGLLVAASTPLAAQSPQPAAPAPRFPPAECQAPVSYDRDMALPGYRIADAAGKPICVPFTTVGAHPPAGYVGDFYVDEFSDEKLRARWDACRDDPACNARVGKVVRGRTPPNREHGVTDPRQIYLLGKIAETPDLDLRSIRRPGFFARAPYREAVAATDPNSYIVEFTAPAEPYERIHRGDTKPIKLRGWYMRGSGVALAGGKRGRALIVMSGGGGTRIAAIDDPSDVLYSIDPKTGKTRINSFPNATTGSPGQAGWRGLMAMFNRAGFDVLAYDRRGIGVSGGYSDTNTLQQGRDLLMVLANLRTGEGMRALTPNGTLKHGADAAMALRGHGRDLPTLLMGNSRGTMATGWAMTMNFDKDCSYDLPEITCQPMRGDRSIKGAMLMAEFTSGVGFVSSTPTAEDEGRGLGKDRGLFIGASQMEHNLVFFPSSAILAGMHNWPAAFFTRGLWDYAAALEGTIDSYDRIKGLKELVVVRGPHPFETWPDIEKERVRQRMLAFAQAAVRGDATVAGGRPWATMRDLVATTNDVWERSTAQMRASSAEQE